jgi:hypothetical protein
MIKEGLLFHIPAKEGKSIRARRNHKKVQKNYCIARTIFSLDNLQILQITLKTGNMSESRISLLCTGCSSQRSAYHSKRKGRSFREEKKNEIRIFRKRNGNKKSYKRKKINKILKR